MCTLDIPEDNRFMKNLCAHSAPKTNCNLRQLCSVVMKADLNECQETWTQGFSGWFVCFVFNNPAKQFGGSHLPCLIYSPL